MAKQAVTSVPALGCVSRIALGIGIIATVTAAWLWSQGADPRASVEQGLVIGAWVTGGGCVLGVVALLFVIAMHICSWSR